MTQLQEWAAALCTTGIGCALLHMLCPAGVMRRVFGTLTAVFFLCCLLSPLRSLLTVVSDVFAFPAETEVPTALSEEVSEQAETILSEVLLEDARGRLTDTATVKNVTVCRDNAREDGIYIERVRVTLDKEDRAAASTVRTVLQQAWGVIVEVYYVG